MNEEQIKAMIMDVIKHADYDLWKSLNIETAEDEDEAKRDLDQLHDIAKKHIDKFDWRTIAAADGYRKKFGASDY